MITFGLPIQIQIMGNHAPIYFQRTGFKALETKGNFRSSRHINAFKMSDCQLPRSLRVDQFSLHIPKTTDISLNQGEGRMVDHLLTY